MENALKQLSGRRFSVWQETGYAATDERGGRKTGGGDGTGGADHGGNAGDRARSFSISCRRTTSVVSTMTGAILSVPLFRGLIDA